LALDRRICFTPAGSNCRFKSLRNYDGRNVDCLPFQARPASVKQEVNREVRVYKSTTYQIFDPVDQGAEQGHKQEPPIEPL
jgi:hypothetical protein